MATLLRDLLAREQLRTISALPVIRAASKPAGKKAPAEEEGPEDKWEKQNNTAAPTSMRQQPGEMPMHQVSLVEKKRSPKQQAMRQNFLRKAVGGNPNGFITKDPLSHNVAKGLARTGHLNHMGSMQDEKKGGTINHWQLTEKGMALAQGSTLNPNAAQNMPPAPQGGMPQKPNQFANVAKNKMMKNKMMGR